MAYFDRTDVLDYISSKHLEQLEAYNATLIDNIVPDVESEVQSYLQDLYKLDAEFILTGTDREKVLVTICCHMAIYYAYMQVANDQIPDIKVKAYDDSIKALKDFGRGIRYFNKIEKQDPDGGRSIRWGTINGADENQNAW